VDRLSTLRVALLRELSGNHARFRFINTRLILSVGVDLNQIHRNPEVDGAKTKLALDTLQKMGLMKEESSEGSRGA
jgi:hypothetical protein